MKKYLIVGLGNVGQQYVNTRHNIGFKVLDTLADRSRFSFESGHLAHRCNFNIKGRRFILIKPTTYMNLSGKAVIYWLEKERVNPENMLVVTDDIHLAFGSFRIKKQGSDGGHNGLKDIQEKLNTTTYNRFRFGVGEEFQKGRQADYVLGEWTASQQKELEEGLLQRATEAVETFVLEGIDNAMNRFNSKKQVSS